MLDKGTLDRTITGAQGARLGVCAIGTNAIGGISSRRSEYFVFPTTPMISYVVSG